MTRLKFLALMLALGGAVATGGCGSDNDDPAAAAQTTTQLAQQEIGTNTADAAAPLPLNDIAVPDGDTSETALPQEI